MSEGIQEGDQVGLVIRLKGGEPIPRRFALVVVGQDGLGERCRTAEATAFASCAGTALPA